MEATVIDKEDLPLLYHKKKKEIVNFLNNTNTVDSISELADRLGRDYSAVYRDVADLEEAGILESEEYKGKTIPKISNRYICLNPTELEEITDSHSSYHEINYNSASNGVYYGELKDDNDNIKSFIGDSEDIFVEEKSGRRNVCVNLFGEDEVYHNIITGQIGSGKTFQTKYRIMQAMDYYDDLTVITVSPLGEYRNISMNAISSIDDVEVGKINNLYSIDDSNYSSAPELSEAITSAFEDAVEKASQIDGKVIIVVDEAQYVMRNNDIMPMIDKANENNTSINLATQSLVHIDYESVTDRQNIILSILTVMDETPRELLDNITLPLRPFNININQAILCRNGWGAKVYKRVSSKNIEF